MLKFHEVVKAARVEAGLSLQKAADKLGTFKGYICGIENQKVAAPSPKLVAKLAKLYGLNPIELLGLSEASKTAKPIRKLFEEFADGYAHEIRGRFAPTVKPS